MKKLRLPSSDMHALMDERKGHPTRSTYLRAIFSLKSEGLMLPSIHDHDVLLFQSASGISVSKALFRRRRDSRRGVKDPTWVGPGSYLHMDLTLGLQKLHAYYPAWARELLILPEREIGFMKGKDAKDPKSRWLLPCSSIPREAFGMPDAGLLIDKAEIEFPPLSGPAKAIVHPGKVVVLEDLARGYGVLVPSTGFPRKASRQELLEHGLGPYYSDIDPSVRRLMCPDHAFIGPLVRGLWIPGPLSDGRHALVATYPWEAHGVGGVSLERMAPSASIQR